MSFELSVVRDNAFSYRICFHNDFRKITEEFRRDGIAFGRVCIVTDTHVAKLYADQVRNAMEGYCRQITVYTIPAGEEHKNLDTIQGIYTHLIENGLDRNDMLIALGGGVVGDMTGYAAATYLRGIRFIQIPTTLLAQVDSSIGGKTGVDFARYKNMVGAFHQPVMVYINLSVLRTLDRGLFACGMGEVIKYGYIRDRSFLDWLRDNHTEILSGEAELLSEMIYRSCMVKRDVVAEDPSERGIRAILNFGHTIGHAVEKLKDFLLPHGQCVAVGCVAAAWLSLQKGMITEEDYGLVENMNRIFNLPLSVEGLGAEEILEATKKDKKMSGGRIKFILLNPMGTAFIDSSVTDDELSGAISHILQGETKSCG